MTELPANVVVRALLKREYSGYSLTDGDMLRALSRAEDRHFWQLSRNQFIVDQLTHIGVRPGARILELGCGGGCVTAHLSRLGYLVTGVDGHLPRILEAAARAPAAKFIVEDLARDGALREENGFDVVGLFDVIEHLDDPKGALEGALQRARPGGYVVGTVPALMALWSEADRCAGHRVRYAQGSLKALLRSVSGAIDLEIKSFNHLLIPLLWVQRRVVSKGGRASGEHYYRVPCAPINAVLYSLLRLEHRLGRRFRRFQRLPGASLWFAFRKVCDR